MWPADPSHLTAKRGGRAAGVNVAANVTGADPRLGTDSYQTPAIV
jgi:hypothetical protein